VLLARGEVEEALELYVAVSEMLLSSCGPRDAGTLLLQRKVSQVAALLRQAGRPGAR
jgi:hypothetical protein